MTDAMVIPTWFGGHIASSAVEAGARTALVFEGGSWTYAELDLMIRRAVARLRNLGVRKGDRVVVQGSARPEAFVALFAVTRMGAVVVPLHPQVAEAEFTVVCGETSPRAVIGDLPAGGHARLAWDDLCPDDQVPVTAPPDPPAGDDIAIIPFTSGTSGRAKGVALTHDNLHWSMRNGLARLPLGEDDVALVATPLAHVAVLGGLPQYTWVRRGTVVLAPKFDPDLVIDLVRDHRVTTAFAVPAMLALLARHPRFTAPDLDSLKWILAGGSPAVSSTTTRLLNRGIRVVNSYGLTEASAGVTYASIDEVANLPTSAGHPVPHIELRIVDDRGQPLPAGGVGEIRLRGPSIASSYWTGTGPLPTTDPDGWFHTGDRGRLDAQDRLEVVGRTKDTIITGGENVDPAEVENALADLPGVVEIAVAGSPDPVWGELVTVFLVTDGRPVSIEDIRRHLDGKIAKHKGPRRLHVVTALPRGATGKLQRNRLTELIPHPTATPGRTP